MARWVHKLDINNETRKQFRQNLSFYKYYNSYYNKQFLYGMTSFKQEDHSYCVVMDLSEYDIDYFLSLLNRKDLEVSELDKSMLHDELLREIESKQCNSCSFIRA